MTVFQVLRMCKETCDQETAGKSSNKTFIASGPSINEWENVVSDPSIAFEDFVNVDDDFVVYGEHYR